MKMWIIPVAVWVGLATSTLFAPKPDNNGGFPLDPTTQFPAALDPKKAAANCNTASWVTSLANKQRCAKLNEHLTDVQNAYKGMPPLDLQNIKDNSNKISSSPAWKNLVWAKNKCPNYSAGLDTLGCPLTQKEFNTAAKNLININKQVLDTIEDCLDKQNRVENAAAAKKVPSFCAAQALLLTQDLTAQWRSQTQPGQDKKSSIA